MVEEVERLRRQRWTGKQIAAATGVSPATVSRVLRRLGLNKLSALSYWSMNTDTMGVYGNYYLKRAIIAQLGLGANVPEDAIYPLNLADETGKPLDGASKYTIHFDKGATPPANAFWSLTLYDSDGFQVANSLNRFAVSSWMAFKYNSDGSLDLYFQNESPGADKEVNWLPAPKGPFNLTMRLYAPKSDAPPASGTRRRSRSFRARRTLWLSEHQREHRRSHAGRCSPYAECRGSWPFSSVFNGKSRAAKLPK